MENNKKISVNDKDINELTFNETSFRVINTHGKLYKLNERIEYLTEQLKEIQAKVSALNQELKMLDRHQELQWHKERLWQVGWREREKIDVDKEILRVKKRHAKEDGLI